MPLVTGILYLFGYPIFLVHIYFFKLVFSNLNNYLIYLDIMNEKERKRGREQLLCGMAMANCTATVNYKDFYENDEIADACRYVSSLCKKFEDTRCQKQSILCYEASLAIRNDDMIKYTILCHEALDSCPSVERIKKWMEEDAAKKPKKPKRKRRDFYI